MKIADLYIRVSTDEQKDKGYSQRNQQEQLSKYCTISNIQIGRIIFEDHSAKNFNRPEWKKLLASIRRDKGGKTDLILFTKWDRFSRNTADAYQMINTLRKFGIEPQAVEQPLDLSVPENKMMLAFYLAIPEVENDRRSLNVFFGMRRAKKEGRWMATAPIGYINKTSEDDRKYITPHPKNAPIMQWAFEQLALGDYTMTEILREARKKGLKCSKNNFWVAMRNPVYCGKIFVARHKDEDACLVDGLHKPIISEATFNDAQDVMNGRKKANKVKIASLKELPLRGFLTCPKCFRNLSGSPSKGKNQYYYYYHCLSTCGYRVNANTLNEEFIKLLHKFAPIQGMEDLYVKVIEYHYHLKIKQSNNFKRPIIKEIEEIEARQKRIRELLIDKSIDANDYRQMKSECDEKLNRLEADLRRTDIETFGVKKIFENLVNTLVEIDLFFKASEVQRQRGIVATIYPHKFELQNSECRTPLTNSGAAFIYNLNGILGQKKNGTELDFTSLSHQVIPLGFEPRTTTLKV
jgi:site-specific DNA recombinase